MMLFFIFLAAAYTLGSVNVSILLFRLLGKEDPRTAFSGNAGATNVYRQAGLFWASAVLLLDMGRAMLIAGAALFILDAPYVTWAGLALVLGNRYPCFHGFKGGKGVANYLGFTLVLAPGAALASALAWAAVYQAFRKPFLSSFAMTLLLAIGTINRFLGTDAMSGGGTGLAVMGSALTAVLIFVNHKENIMQALKS